MLACARRAACCARRRRAAAPAPPAATAAARPRLDRFYAQQLSWGPCADSPDHAEDRIAYADAGFECARLQVPLDYAAPGRRRGQDRRCCASGPRGERIGSLVVNPGGPGASGMELVPALSGRLADSPLARRFDLVGFDPRGVGASTPKINCLDDADWPAERADTDVDPSPAGVAAHRGGEPAATPSAAPNAPAARPCWPTSAPGTSCATWTSCAPRWATRS